MSDGGGVMPSAAARNFVDMLPATSGKVRRLGGLQLFLCCSDFLKRRIKIRRADSDIEGLVDAL